MTMQRKNTKVVERGDNLSLAAADGLYNQPLFDLCGNNDLVALSLRSNNALDAIGFETSNVYRLVENFITYIAPDGTAAGSPTSGVITSPCEPGQQIESGGVTFELEGWGRLRRSSPVRDITDLGIRYCEKTPIYDLAGSRIDNDYEWDVVRMMTVIMQDLNRQVIVGDNSVAGQADGLRQLVNYNYTDPRTLQPAKIMDSYVLNWNNNPMCQDAGASGVTYNGNATANGFNIIDYIRSFLRRTAQRINMSSLSGQAPHIGLLPTEHLTDLIRCYVCYTVCGNDITRMDSWEARTRLSALETQFGNGSVTLNFDGFPVTFIPYDYELLSSDGKGEMYILTPNIGNTPVLRFQVKDMSAIAATPPAQGAYRVTDNNRVLSWETRDHTCYQVHSEIQWRAKLTAPWAQMRVYNMKAAGTMFGAISGDPLSVFHPDQNKATSVWSKATVGTFDSYTNPVAVDDFYYTPENTNLVKAANVGLLANDTGTPTPVVTAVTSAATSGGGGAITIAANGSFTFVPTASFTGVTTYTYTITNAKGTDTGVVTIVVY